MSLRCVPILVFLCFVGLVFANVADDRSRVSRRVKIPFLGIGPTCHGCPPHYCDDDPAIVHGYCCGCARFYDVLPVKCPPFLNCPLNPHLLCEDYEYMMYCCCD